MDQASNIKTIVQAASKTKKLDLSYMQLTEIPEQVLKIKNLEHLNLSHNNITTLPDSISKLTSLKHLDLSSNSLTSISPSISQCTNLETLILSYNLKLQTLPYSLTELRYSLKEVRLFENELFPTYVRSNASALFQYLTTEDGKLEETRGQQEKQHQEELAALRNARILANKEKRMNRAYKAKKDASNKSYNLESKSRSRVVECYD